MRSRVEAFLIVVIGAFLWTLIASSVALALWGPIEGAPGYAKFLMWLLSLIVGVTLGIFGCRHADRE